MAAAAAYCNGTTAQQPHLLYSNLMQGTMATNTVMAPVITVYAVLIAPELLFERGLGAGMNEIPDFG